MTKLTKVKPYQEILISRIVRNPEQPRKVFNQDELQELAQSIRENGVIQPIILEECGDDYMLHDGERRLRAAQIAGKKRIVAIVHPPLNGTGPRERLERAIVANVQRVEMHAIEEGLGYQRLITEFDYTISQVAKKVGKNYTRIAFCLYLLKLDEPILALMMERKLPAERDVVDAFMSVGDRASRVKLAEALAERKATRKMIIYACQKFNGVTRRQAGRKGSPATRMIERSLPEWDALYQLGKVPPWQTVTNAVMETCDACPLRPMASDTTCRDCALVFALTKMMEAAHAKK